MTIHHTIDDARRILIIELSGIITGHSFSVFICKLYSDRPELFDYACVLDQLQYEGDVSYADLNPLEQIYAERPEVDPSSKPGFIITSDPNFHFWATALDEQFPGRKHYVVASREEAFSRLGEMWNMETGGPSGGA
jgi:hypothetical protein